MKIESILALFAGLGLFLYGMKLMSEGLEKAAGAKLRRILEMCTKNRFLGMLVGIFFTAVVQSSSATTVLVVSFVNAGLLNLMQAAGVILGANIGTTVTAQLIAFNLSAAAPVFIFAGVCMVMFVSKPLAKRIGEIILGFGILFFGISIMSDSMNALKTSKDVIDLIASMDKPYLALLVGFVITAIVQSSSATVGIVMVMASQKMIPLELCFYIILGCNMGSCVSALLACLGSKKNAKRAAWIHFLVNILGSAVIYIILCFAENNIRDFMISISGRNGTAVDEGVRIAREVANSHLVFKLFQVLICFPLIPAIVKLTMLIIPGEDKKADNMHLEYIGEIGVFSTSSAIPNAINEIVRMGQIAIGNLQLSLEALLSGSLDSLPKIYATEKGIDYLNSEITNYLVKANQYSLPVDDRKIYGALFHVVNDIERIGDHAENISEFAKQAAEENLHFSDEAIAEIQKMATTIYKLLQYSIEMFEKNSNEHLQEILIMEEEVDEMEKMYQQSHVDRLTKNMCDVPTGMIYSDLLSNLERVADHGTNIAFSILDASPEDE